MESSRRAVESYWRSRMIDTATSDEDKVTPVYKLEEICDLLRSSHVSIVKEVSDFILKRLDHKSPVVKQKALRLIKYSVGKSGAEFQREMQRHSAVVRQLLHYKGQPDPLKGDALNKAVRDTAQETISTIFSDDNNKPSPAENLNKRIQGFGNTNFDTPPDDRKSSFLSEVVGMGSASIKQGISNLTQGNLLKKNDNGSYKGPNLRSSFSSETDSSDRYEPVKLPTNTQNNYGVSKPSGPWGQDSKVTTQETMNGSSSNYRGSKTREERLVETIVTSSGVRLQPTRDAIQVFLVEAAKLDALALSHTLESKLQSPMWQVRMKAVCVLESVLRKKDDDHFSIVASYFTENKDVVIRCSDSPQNSLREKANKVLNLLGGEHATVSVGIKSEAPSVQMPDLIDTGDTDDFLGTDDFTTESGDNQILTNPTTSAPPLIDDLFGDSFNSGISTTDQKNDDDPFSDVSFHNSETKEQVDNLFSGMAIGEKPRAEEPDLATHKAASDPFDIFGSNNEIPDEQQNHKANVSDLMAGMSINENILEMKQGAASQGMLLGLSSHSNSNHGISSDALNELNASPMFSTGAMPYNLPPGVMLNPAFYSQPMNYAAMGSFLTQQQLLATMSNFQQLANMNAQTTGFNNASSSSGGGHPSPLPDIFQPSFANQPPSSMMNSSKKEDTRAFDFISDHLAAARDPKRVV